MFETASHEGLVRLRRTGARWLSTGPNGGFETADAADNLTVADGFQRTDLEAYVAERRAAAGVDGGGPALLTGVEQRHARRSRSGAVTVVATAGLSNPAWLPVGEMGVDEAAIATERADWQPGTVNLLVGVGRRLDDGTLAELLATCVEAKAAALSAVAGVPGTTSDAIAVGCVPDAERTTFAGSATEVGGAARACVRDAVLASLNSRHGDLNDLLDDADHGVVTERSTETEPL